MGGRLTSENALQWRHLRDQCAWGQLLELESPLRCLLSEPPSLRMGFRFTPGNLPAFQRSSVTTTTQRVSVSGTTSRVGPPACAPARTLVETAYKIFVALKVGGRLNWEGQGLLGS